MYNSNDFKKLMELVQDEPTEEEIDLGLKKKKLTIKQLFENPKEIKKKKSKKKTKNKK